MKRRDFLNLSQSAAIYLIGGKVFFGELVSAQTRRAIQESEAGSFLTSLPHFDGVFLFDSSTLNQYSRDFGLNVSYRPQGILKPNSVTDIQKMVAYCSARGIPLTIRGGGGAAYGQSQVQNGIIIDTTTMKKARWISNNEVSLEAGLIWKEVLDFTIQKKMTPPVLPDTLVTTVGGLSSAGGIGETSFNLGAIVDHVTEVDVVTMGGELRTCSPTQNTDLFYAALGGMGQCGILVRLTLRLMRAPASVRTLPFVYEVENPLLVRDLDLILRLESQGAVAGHFRKLPDVTRMQYQLDASFWGRDSAPWIESLAVKPGPIKTWSFYDYANRNTKNWLEAVAAGGLNLPRPYLSFYMPMEMAQATIEYLFGKNESLVGVSRIYMAPLIRKNFKRPFLSLPKSDKIMHFRLYKVIQGKPGSQDHLTALRANEMDLLPRILNNGGTVYLPFAPLLKRDQILKQYDSRVLQSFGNLKQHYDRRVLLNRSVGLFN